MAKNIKCQFTHRRVGFAKAELYDAYKPYADSPFAVFKNDAGVWSVGHLPSRAVIDSILPDKITRSRFRLILWLEEMARDEPEATAMLGLVDSLEMMQSSDFKEYGDRLREWSKRYVCV